MAEMRSSVYEIANYLKQTQLNRTRTIKTKIGVFGGSFDPITLGHEHVVKEAVKLMDYVIIAIALNPTKKHRFTQEGRRRMVLSAIANLNTDRSKVILLEVPENELLASWAYKLGANTLFRGIRTGTDLENEQTIQFVQNKVAPNMSMVHILPPRDLLEVSSSLIRNSLHLRDWELIVNGYVSRGVFNYIEENRNVD
jgi:pantetheine-phosphate adenylyltransferase